MNPIFLLSIIKNKKRAKRRNVALPTGGIRESLTLLSYPTIFILNMKTQKIMNKF